MSKKYYFSFILIVLKILNVLFCSDEGQGLDETVCKENFQIWMLTLKCQVIKENGRLQKKLRLNAVKP